MIEFISYDGTYPNLCSGKATFKIDGKIVEFAVFPKEYSGKVYDSFWSSGGCIQRNKDWDMWTEEAPWKLDLDWWRTVDEDHPQWLIDLLPELLRLFNKNVRYGCCGGCI